MFEAIEQVAKVCHEANRAYCETLEDNSQPSWADAPEWQKQSARNGVKFHFAQHAVGVEPSPSASHEKWLEEKRVQGWKYGPVKDPDKKEHPCFVEYDQLPLDQRRKDYIFAAICKAFASSALLVATLVFAATAAMAQRDGIPSFVAADRFQYDTVNLLTLQTSIDIPVLAKSAGALPGSITLTSPQYCYTGLNAQQNPITLCNGNQFDFIPDELSGIKAQYTSQSNPGCTINGQVDIEYFVIGLVGADGLSSYHVNNPVGGNGALHSIAACGSQSATFNTTDGTGLTALINFQSTYQVTGYVQSISNTAGWSTGYQTAFTDAFGNTIGFGVNGSNQTYFQDTLGAQTIVPTLCCGAGTYTYKDTSGTSRNVTVTAGTATSFYNPTCGTSGVTTYTPISSITYPDGTSFSFTWDSLQSGTLDGLIKSFTTPSGGTITYTYGTMVCAPWSYSTLSRQTPDGTTTYSTSVNGSITTTTELDPVKDKIVTTFFGTSTSAAVFTKDITRYQNTGTIASPVYTEVSYTKYCYNNASCTTAPTYPITQRDTYEYLGTGPTSMSHRVQTYDSTYGLLLTDATTELTTTPNVTVTKTYVYGTWNGTSCAGITNTEIHDHVCTVTTTSGSTWLSEKSFAYNANGALTASTVWLDSNGGADGNNLNTNYTPNSNGTTASMQLPSGQSTTYAYNGTGGCNNLLPTSSSTTLTVPTTVTLTTSTQYNCDAALVTQTTDANSNNASFTYDSMNRTSSSTDPVGFTVDNSYTATSATASWSMTSPSASSSTTVTGDSSGRPVNIQTTHGSNYDTVSTSYGYSGTNFQIQGSEPCSTTTIGSSGCSMVHSNNSALGIVQSLSTSSHETNAFTYSANDISLQLSPHPTGENNKLLQQEFDGFGRIKSTCSVLTSGGTACGQAMGNSGVLTTYTYSFSTGASKVVVTRGSQSHTTNYDTAGRLSSETYPESGTRTYVYDSRAANYCNSGDAAYSSPGNLVATTDGAGNKLCFNYDALSRLTSVTNNHEVQNSGNTYCKHFRYDSTANALTTNQSNGNNLKGRMLEAETDTCAATLSVATDQYFDYDADGRVVDIPTAVFSTGYNIPSAQYFLNGVIHTLTDPNGGNPYGKYTVSLDANGNPTSATWPGSPSAVTVIGGITRDSGGRSTSIQVGSNSADTDTYSWDGNTGNMTQFKFTVNGSSMTGLTGNGVSTPWNANGTLGSMGITDGFNSGGTQTCNYGYDDISRLTSANCGTPFNNTYSYDQYDNLAQTGTLSWNPGYSSSTNQETGATYDNAGNELTDGINTYTWDAYGKMASVRTGNSAAVCGTSGTCIFYDAFGMPAAYQTSTSTTRIARGPGGFTEFNGTAVRLTVPGGGILWANGTNEQNLNYEHMDWLGSARLTTNVVNRTPASDTAYAPYGQTYASFGLAQNTTNFTGDNQDLFAGLFDTPNRELLQNAGRWRSPDPAHSGWNAYAYPTDPLTQTDPSGLLIGDPCPEGDACDKKHNDPCTGSGILLPCGGKITVVVGPPIDDPTANKKAQQFLRQGRNMAMVSIFKFFPEMTPEQSIVYNKAQLGEAVKMLQDLTQKFEAQRKLIDYLTEQTANLRRSASKLSNNRQFDEIMAERYKAVADGLTLKDTMTELNAEIQRVSIDIQQIANRPDFDILGSASVDYIGAGLSAFGLWEMFMGSTANSSQDATYWSPGIHSSQWYKDSPAPGIDGPWPTLPRRCTTCE